MISRKGNPDRELVLRVKTIMVLRAVLLTGFVALILPFQHRVGFTGDIYPLSYVIGAGYFLTILYALLFNHCKLSLTTAAQFVGDLLLVGGIIFTTGGINSPLSFLYLFVIIATSVVYRRAACYLAASGASILYGLLVDLEYFNVIQPYHLFSGSFVPVDSGYGFYLIFLNVASYFAVAFLSSILSQRLRIIKEELALTHLDLKELQAFHSNVVQDMGNGLVTTDLDGMITSVNVAAEEITGYALVQCLGESCNKILPIPELEKLFEDSDSATLPLEVEGWCRRKDDKSVFIHMKVSRFSGHGEPVKGYICVFEDLTEVKEMHEKIAQAEHLAAVGRISAGLAHEIRNPLAAMSGSIQVLGKSLKLEDSHKKLMEIVLKETDRLNFILSDFLDYSQPRKKGGTAVDLTQVVQDLITLAKNSEDYNPSIEIEFHGNKDHLVIHSDEKQMQQLIWNLCINAMDAMPEGGRLQMDLHSVSSYQGVGYKFRGKGIVLTVQDNGPGIPQDQIQNIFDPFFTTKENGVGLGLATVYQIVQRHGGTIDVKSQVGQGTRFSVFLPDEQPPLEKVKVSKFQPRPAPSRNF